MYCYSSYGLRIHSSLPLPELAVAESALPDVDVIIRPGELETPAPESFEDERHFRSSSDYAFLAWKGIINVEVRAGREVVFHVLKDIDDNWLRQYILGPALGVILHQRGLLVLHASAVAKDGQAIAFLGWKGHGKSTTSAHLHARGYDILSDDMVAIDMSKEDSPMVIPGFPQFKLWPDAIEALGEDPASMGQIIPTSVKRTHRVQTGVAQAPCRLAGIFVLGLGDTHQLIPIASTDAFLAVFQNTYAARFIGQAGLPKWHFHQCASLTRTLPIFRFERKPSLELLPAALDMLEAHLEKETFQLANSSV